MRQRKGATGSEKSRGGGGGGGAAKRKSAPTWEPSEWLLAATVSSGGIAAAYFFVTSLLSGHTSYTAIAGALDETTLKLVEHLGDEVVRRGDLDSTGQTREFGVGQNYLSQHSVTFLHGSKSDQKLLGEVTSAMRTVAGMAAKKAGWSLPVKELNPRCLELIEYVSSGNESNETTSLGWHDDGATQVTVAVLLSRSDEYDGGGLEVKRRDGTVITLDFRPTRGDAVIWRGWDQHRVLPVTRGTRRVVVAEMWVKKPGEGDGIRPLDTMEHYMDGIKVDPSAGTLHAGLGIVNAKHDRLPDAEKSLRKAVSLEPTQASFWTGLGATLLMRDKGTAVANALGMKGLSGGGGKRTEEAANVLRLAAKLDPTAAEATWNLALLSERHGKKEEATFYRARALKIDPGIRSRESSGSIATRLHS